MRPSVAVPLLLLGVLAIGGRAPGMQCALPRDSGYTPLNGLVNYCAPEELPAQEGSVQFLIDGSGSMAGFAAPIVRIRQWVAQSFSQLRGQHYAYRRARSGYFAQGRDIQSTSTSLDPGPGKFAGDTNLHQAVATAREYDLTVLLTDGVAAGGDGSGDCSSGVDAACVARAMRQSLEPRPGEPQAIRAGIWIIPLIAPFSGVLFTEQLLANQEFDPSAALQSVQQDTSTTAEFGPPEQRQGRLAFHYKGPRLLFLLVLARNATIGRAWVAAAAAASSNSQVLPLRQLKKATGQLAYLAPVEVFPGTAASMHWLSGRVPTSRGRPALCGGMDIGFVLPDLLKLRCVSGRADLGIVEVLGAAPTGSSRCVEMMMLPASTLRLSGPGTSALGGFQWRPAAIAGQAGLLLQLKCGTPKLPGCRAPADLQVVRVIDYRTTADSMARSNGSTAPESLHLLSTNRPAQEPVRAFGLASLLEKFYREAAQLNEIEPVATLHVCQE